MDQSPQKLKYPHKVQFLILGQLHIKLLSTTGTETYKIT
uniref:Uncharacterized protein n=1 Tax=Arundo donax TaxID=35708 RepID=A0A0A9BLM2_ARUDO